jgi:hypothetical protein
VINFESRLVLVFLSPVVEFICFRSARPIVLSRSIE